MLGLPPMLQTVEAIIDDQGRIQWLERIPFSGARRVLITLLDPPTHPTEETCLLAESALAEEWLNEDEDAAWAHLQPSK